MRISLFLFLIVLTLVISGFIKQDSKLKPQPVSEDEAALVEQINAYRKKKGLPSIPWSQNLAIVAQLHATDLQQFPPKSPCNMHSWSANGKWKPCCYTPDHKEASCMWNKPKELTGYPGQGFEISAMNTGENVQWLAQWQRSQAHHQVIINEGIWKGKKWNAMGLAIRKPFAVIWFGFEADSAQAE